MQSFTNNFGYTTPQNLNHFIFVHPAFIQHRMPLFPFNQGTQLDCGTEMPSFPMSNAPRQTNLPRIAQTTIKREEPSENMMINFKKVKNDIEEKEEIEQEQFTLKAGKKNSGPSFSYKKKNTQSNIVNQTFSFMCSEKSKLLLKKLFKENPEQIDEYYRAMTKVKQCSKKYINRVYLKRLLAFEKKTEFQRAFLKAKLKFLTIEDLRKTLRVLMFSFLREQVTLSMLTSSKIYKETLLEHFWRKRQISNFLFDTEHQGNSTD